MSAKGQVKKKPEFGNGLRYLAKDSTFYMKFSVRAQNRFDGKLQGGSTPEYTSRFYIRRSRVKFDGWALSPKVVYKLEFDVVGGYVRDACVTWNFYKNLSILYGHAKLPGNLERVVSSQKLQFVDRSLMNDAYNIDRDNGVQLLHRWKAGKMEIREVFAYTHGRGINDESYNDGASFTGRFEILPFGSFTGNGEFFYADFRREKTPKLMLGGTYNFNDEAIKSNGQLGETLNDTRDLSTIFADFILKYQGITASGEFAHKTTTDRSAVVSVDSTGRVTENFMTGYGYNCQVAYLFKSQWEIAGRYTCIIPEKIIQEAQLKEYTFGFSKYFYEHNLKIQSELSYLETTDYRAFSEQQLYFRTQLEISF